MNQPRTPEEQSAWDKFLEHLDNRTFHIEPSGEVYRGRAIDAKRRAMLQLDSLPVGARIAVTNSEGTVWCWVKR